MDRDKILKKLQKDSEYYGKFGKQFLSASNIRQLLYEPTEFNKTIKTLPLLHGRYFHTSILEPEKIDTIPVFNSSSRTTNAFKQFEAEHNLHSYDILLTKEKEKLDKLIEKLLGNWKVFDIIIGDGVQYEVPNIKEIHGQMFKGKCDVLVNKPFEVEVEQDGQTFVVDYPDGAIVDLKTSSSIFKFRHSCNAYCYNSQAYIYQELFDKPFLFIVIDKNDGLLKFAPCSPEFIDKGEDNVKKAIKVYEKFFSDEAVCDIDDYVYTEIL